MLVAKAKVPLKFSFNGYDFNLKRKEKLLFANDVFALLPKSLQTQFEKTHSMLPPFYDGEDLNGKTLLVFAQAAIGDAICMTPALREIKRRYPEMQLWVSISGRARPVLEGLPYIDRLLPHPTPYKEVSKADYLVKAVEMVGSPQFDNMNMVQYFLWKLRVYFAEDETPDIVVDENIKKELEEDIFNELRELAKGKKLLLFHYLASAIHRTLPPKLLKEIEDLIQDEYVPVICSLPEEDITVEVALDVYGIRAANLSPLMKNIKYLIAAVSLVDAVITADTATVHIAGALKKPTVLISGAIEPELRCGTYPTVIPLRPNYKGQVCVCPCMTHALNEPCIEAKAKRQFYSPCLESIPPKVVYFALKDAELACKEDYPKPDKCPVCEYDGNFSVFEVINQYKIFECPSCGLQFGYPMKAMDYEKAYKEEYGDLLQFDPGAGYKAHVEVQHLKKEDIIKSWERLPRINVFLPFLRAIKNKEGEKLLDVGCSVGYFLLIAEKLGFEAYGMEASGEAVKIAKEKFGLNVVQALSFDELPEEFKGPYRVITAFEVLEHVEEPMKFLKSAFELLEEGGFLFISFPSHFKFEHQSFSYRKYKWWYGNYPPNHLTRWKPWTLFYALKKAGFTEVLIFTEPTLPGTILEGAQIKEVELREKGAVKAILPKTVSTAVVLDAFKWLSLNARTLGNFQCAIGVKGKTGYNWEEITKRAIYYSAVETMWGKEDKI